MKRPPAGTIPDSTGVYRFRDADQRVIYVGKATNLRSRIGQYFQDPALLHPRTSSMVQTATELDWTVVGNEVEALQLEYAWIKEFDPRFNVKYRDDKSYPYLAITVGEEFPRAQVLRGSKRKGVRYFGPYSHAWAIRETLDQLLRVFPIRSCSAGVFRRAKQINRPCLLGYIGKCSAPCVGRVTADEHRELVDDLSSFLSGNTQKYIKRIERDMKAASDLQDYERAARLRDDIKALERALARNAVVLPDETDADVVAIAADDLEAAFQVFHVRGGRVRGQRGMVSEKTESGGNGVALGQFLAYLYAEVVPDDIPKEILVPQLPDDANAISAWLSEQRGSRVPIKVPARGDKRALMETVGRNAYQSLSLHKVRRTGDLTARALALEELQEALALPEAPLRIECYDVSHLAGTDRVASMVVFEDGLPRKAHYRKFNLRGEGNDDVAAMREVIERRFQRLLDETENTTAESVIDAESGKPKRFAYRPQLVVVDGGAAQVAAAAEVLGRLGITDVTTIGLAKRLEEVWVADEVDPLILARGSQALYLLQRIRDEAHRFAITFQRQKRGKRATRSELEQVPGLGESRRKALLATFGSVKRIRAASPEELAAVTGIGPKLAESIVTTLSSAGSQPEPAVNTATGEILP